MQSGRIVPDCNKTACHQRITASLTFFSTTALILQSSVVFPFLNVLTAFLISVREGGVSSIPRWISSCHLQISSVWHYLPIFAFLIVFVCDVNLERIFVRAQELRSEIFFIRQPSTSTTRPLTYLFLFLLRGILVFHQSPI